MSLRARFFMVILVLAASAAGLTAGSTAGPAAAQTSWFGQPVYVSNGVLSQGAEPSIRVDESDPNQRIWIAAPQGITPSPRTVPPGVGGGDVIWYSDDDGRTWVRVNGPAGAGNPTLIGGGDSDVATTTGPQVYATGLTLANVTLAASCRNGETGTWSTNPISNAGTIEDRQWIDAYEDRPKPSPTAPDFLLNYGGVLERRIWFHQVFSPACAPPVAGPRIDTSPGNCVEGVFDDDCYQWPGNLAVDENTGDVYVTHNTFGTPPDTKAVLEPVEEVCELSLGDERCEEVFERVPERSTAEKGARAERDFGDDVIVSRVVGGASRPVTQLDVEVEVAADNRPDTFDSFTVVAVDQASNVYVVWTERYPGGKRRPGHTDTMLAVREFEEEKWSDPIRVSRRPETNTTTFPWIVAGDAGRIDIVYYATSAAGPSPERVKETSLWRVWMAQSLNALDPNPTFVEIPVSPYMHRGSICTSGTGCSPGTRDLLDFFQIDVDAEGLANIAYTDNLNTPPDPGDPVNPRIRKDRHQEWVTFVQQVAGGRLYVE